jgi:hypothetical protein
MTKWAPIHGFESLYEISFSGQVRSTKGYSLSPWRNRNGYWMISLSGRGRRTHRYIHRLMLESFIGPAPSRRHTACHNDGDKSNNHLSNLRWDTRLANHLDKKRHGTFQAGENHGMAKLSEADVAAIRASSTPGVELAARFGVTPTTISHIRRGRTWRTKNATRRAEIGIR